MTDDVALSMQRMLAHLVEETPGVIGALVASADGFPLAAALPDDGRLTIDEAGTAAMSAATLALSNQLVAVHDPRPAHVSHHVADSGQVMIVPIAHVAALTLFAAADAEAGVLARSAHRLGHQLIRLFRGTATV